MHEYYWLARGIRDLALRHLTLKAVSQKPMKHVPKVGFCHIKKHTWPGMDTTTKVHLQAHPYTCHVGFYLWVWVWVWVWVCARDCRRNIGSKPSHVDMKPAAVQGGGTRWIASVAPRPRFTRVHHPLRRTHLLASPRVRHLS